MKGKNRSKIIIFPAVLLIVLLAAVPGCKKSDDAAPATPTYYRLNVSMTSGVTGSPGAGSAQHTEGAAVDYSYLAESDYTGLKVLLDGAEVTPSGSLTMAADHQLVVSAIRDISGHWFFELSWTNRDCPFQPVQTEVGRFECDIQQNGDQLILTGDGGDFVFTLNGSIDPETLAVDLAGDIVGPDPSDNSLDKIRLIFDGTFDGTNLTGTCTLEWHFSGSTCYFDGTFAARL